MIKHTEIIFNQIGGKTMIFSQNQANSLRKGKESAFKDLSRREERQIPLGQAIAVRSENYKFAFNFSLITNSWGGNIRQPHELPYYLTK